MEYSVLGNPKNPALVCVPGLLGGPEDFANLVTAWTDHFHIILLDPNSANRADGLANIKIEVMKEYTLNSSSSGIKFVMDQVGVEKAFLVGISIGGKIVYDFALKYPDSFLGALITDVSPGPFSETTLFQHVKKVVTETDMNQEWKVLKKDLSERIKDRNLRSLIQTQVSYPERKPPAIWKVGMKNFEEMLERQSIGNQFEDLAQADDDFVKRKTFFEVFKASEFTGISDSQLEKMQALKSVRITPVPNSTHFLHVSHKELIRETVVDKFTAPKN